MDINDGSKYFSEFRAYTLLQHPGDYRREVSKTSSSLSRSHTHTLSLSELRPVCTHNGIHTKPASSTPHTLGDIVIFQEKPPSCNFRLFPRGNKVVMPAIIT